MNARARLLAVHILLSHHNGPGSYSLFHLDYFAHMLCLCFSLVSGGANGNIAIHDLHNVSGCPKHTYTTVCSISRATPGRHKHSVETVSWYPLDTGMFLTSGMDHLLKVWDTNQLRVCYILFAFD